MVKNVKNGFFDVKLPYLKLLSSTLFRTPRMLNFILIVPLILKLSSELSAVSSCWLFFTLLPMRRGHQRNSANGREGNYEDCFQTAFPELKDMECIFKSS